MRRTVTVLLFGPAREAAGSGRLIRPLAAERPDLGSLLDGLRADFPSLGAVLKSSRFWRNGRQVAGRTVRLQGGDEIAIHPPYSGG